MTPYAFIAQDGLKTRFNEATTLATRSSNSPHKSPIGDNDDTEIVVVSDTVRQRRARTPQSGESANSSHSESPTKPAETSVVTAGEPVMPDVLPPQTFRLAESSTLFSQISLNPAKVSKAPPPKPAKTKRKAPSTPTQVVEIKVKNIQNDKMSVQNIALEPLQGEIVDTVNILESVEPFVPEYVETVQIVDLSEDSDSSLRVDSEGKEVRRSKSKHSLNDSPLAKVSDEDEDEEQEEDLLRPGANNTSTPFLRVEKHRISFDEKRKRIANERDILRDSEEDDPKTPDTPQKTQVSKPKRWRQLQPELEALDPESPGRDSFYSPDKESGFDVEPLVFSDDEDIPRFSMEMTPTIDSDSDTVIWLNIFKPFYSLKFIF